jgi:hypothetical protein
MTKREQKAQNRKKMAKASRKLNQQKGLHKKKS